MLLKSNLFFKFKFVSHPSECYDVIPIWAQVISQIFNMGINRSVIAEEVVAPDVREQLISG